MMRLTLPSAVMRSSGLIILCVFDRRDELYILLLRKELVDLSKAVE
jgi:hypothetical protein